MSDAGSTSGMTVDDRERFALALEATDDGLWDWHLPSGQAYFNPRYYTMLGYEPGELPASYEGWAGLVHPDDLPHAEVSLQRHLASQSARFEIVFRLRTRGGDWRWILSRGRVAERDAAGQPLRLVGLHSDITERVRSVEALIRSESKFRSLVEQSSDGIVLIDDRGIVLEWNIRAQEISGLPWASAVGRPIWDVYSDIVSDTQRAHLSPASLRLDIENLGQVCAVAWPEMAGEQEIVRPDGTSRIVQSRLFPIRTEQGLLLGAISRDVTDQKQMEAALLRSARLTAAGRLAASVAHEINNPIQSIIGCLSLARREVDSGGSLDEYLEVAQAEIQRVARTVAQIRDLHRPFDGERLPVDVNPLLAQVLDLTRKKCQNGDVAVVWQPGEALPRPALVPDQLKQVCLNLVLNAVDAMPGGGALRVTTAATAQPRGVAIEVADTGTGIAPEVRPLIFEPFYSTRHEGLGLGLSISLGLVEQLGGHITVDSRPGEGSTFRVWLPA